MRSNRGNKFIFIFIIALLIKLFIFRFMVLEDLSWQGIIADLATVGFLLAMPAILWTGVFKKVVQTIMMIGLSMIWFAGGIYYSYYGNIPTYHTLANLNQVGQIRQSITASIEPYMWLYFADFVIAFIVFIIIKARKARHRQMNWSLQSTSLKPKTRLRAFLIWIVCGVAIAGCLYMNWNIENSHALSKRLGMITYQLAVALQPEEGAAADEITDEERAAIYQSIEEQLALYHSDEEPIYHGLGEGDNLIVLQVEAMQNFVINLEIDGQAITPNLNQLAANSFYFPRMYQQIAEGNTSDAEFMMNTGAYPSAVQATSKQLTGKKAYSLPSVLAQNNYESYTFHVNDVSFWNRNEMYPALGFTTYFDKPSFENDEFNYFGASDEQLFKFALSQFAELQQREQAFYAHIVTVSSHHPFRIPEQYQMLQLPTELQGTQLGDYLQAIHYVDQQIGSFMSELEKMGLLEKSIVAIYGDHFGLQPKDNDPNWVSEQLNIPYHETVSRMNIPFIITVPGVEGEVIDTLVAGQVDMLPTLINLLGIDVEPSQLLMFGQDLLNTDTNIVGSRYYLPTGSYFNDDVLFIPGAGFRDGQAISLDSFEPVELTDDMEKDYRYIVKWLQLSDQYTSNYPSRSLAE